MIRSDSFFEDKIGVRIGRGDRMPYRVDENYHGGKGRIQRMSIFNQHSLQETTLQIWRITPQSSEGMHVHGIFSDASLKMGPISAGMVSDTIDLEEIYLVLRGNAVVNFVYRQEESGEEENSSLEMSKGDAVLIPAGIPHGIRNSSDTEDLVLLITWGTPKKLSPKKFLRGLPMTAIGRSAL